MRRMFSRQLVEARHEMLSIFEAVDLALHDAVTSLVENDKKLAKSAMEQTLTIDARCANLEAVCYNLIATQGPMASDLRQLQTIIFSNFNFERMSNHVRGIARGARKSAKTHPMPQELRDLIDNQARLVYRVLGETVSALVNNDLARVMTLEALDEPVDEAYKDFYRVLMRMMEEGTADEGEQENPRRAIMASRYLERISDISVEIGTRLVYMLTGRRYTPTDLTELDDEELEAARVPSGEGVIMEPEVDAAFVANMPKDELPPEFAEQVAHAGASEDADGDQA